MFTLWTYGAWFIFEQISCLQWWCPFYTIHAMPHTILVHWHLLRWRDNRNEKNTILGRPTNDVVKDIKFREVVMLLLDDKPRYIIYYYELWHGDRTACRTHSNMIYFNISLTAGLPITYLYMFPKHNIITNALFQRTNSRHLSTPWHTLYNVHTYTTRIGCACGASRVREVST